MKGAPVSTPTQRERDRHEKISQLRSLMAYHRNTAADLEKQIAELEAEITDVSPAHGSVSEPCET